MGHGNIVQLLTTASFARFKAGKWEFERPIGAIPAEILVDHDGDSKKVIGGSGNGREGEWGCNVRWQRLSILNKVTLRQGHGIGDLKMTLAYSVSISTTDGRRKGGRITTTAMKEAIQNSSRIALMLFKLCAQTCRTEDERELAKFQRQSSSDVHISKSADSDSIHFGIKCRNDFVKAERRSDSR